MAMTLLKKTCRKKLHVEHTGGISTDTGFADESTNRNDDSGIQMQQCVTLASLELPDASKLDLPATITSEINFTDIKSESDTIQSNFIDVKSEPSTIQSNFTDIKSEPDSIQSSDPKSSSSVTGTEKVLYRCQVCLDSFTDIEAIRLHGKSVKCRNVVKLSTKDQPFKCEVCERKFNTLYLLRQHLKRHMTSFRCSCCPKSYFTKLELEFHQRTHTNERPHQCDKCPSSFQYAHHLKRHKDIIHFGKRYMCPEAHCNRQFNTLDQLKVHKWSHYGIVPYKCRYCERVFKKRIL